MLREGNDIDQDVDINAVKLAPSILAADFTRLGEQVSEAAQAGLTGYMWM
jgi:hypothetical protein